MGKTAEGSLRESSHQSLLDHPLFDGSLCRTSRLGCSRAILSKLSNQCFLNSSVPLKSC